MTAIAWLRRSLRVHDNTALVEASRSHDRVVPLYIVDEELFDTAELGYPRVRFWRESVEALGEKLAEHGTSLVVRRGDPVEQLRSAVDETGADEVYFNRGYTPYAANLEGEVDNLGPGTRGVKDLVMFEKDEITTTSGGPYRVFSYYRDKWFDREKRGPREVKGLGDHGLDPGQLPSLEELGFKNPGLDWVWRPGRDGGLERLEGFTREIGEYADKRDYPAEDATSRLSPHLRFGTVSVREVFEAAEEAKTPGSREGVETWQEELAWRDFYFQLLWNFPGTVEEPFQEKYSGISWRSRSEASGDWERFTGGRTGFPFIDAGMRQLAETGWMHNRLRMAVTSFAAKDLFLDWRDLHDFFSRSFVDADVPAMVGGIQWAYSIGTDPVPYFRVFNPWKQGEDYDPDGEFIKSFVPELEDVPGEYIHRPHEMPEEVQESSGCIIGDDYPEPMVDHQEKREEAINRFEKARD